MVDEIWPQHDTSFTTAEGTTASIWSTDVPIFRGGCEAEEQEEQEETHGGLVVRSASSVVEFGSVSTTAAVSDGAAAPAAAAAVMTTRSAAGVDSDNGSSSSEVAATATPVHSAGRVGGGDSNIPMRVRLSVGEAGIATAAAAATVVAADVSTGCREEVVGAGVNATASAAVAAVANTCSGRVPGFQEVEEEEEEEETVGGEEDDLRNTTRGCCTTAMRPVHHNSRSNGPPLPATSPRWEQSMSADQLIALTTTSPQPRKPVRLFLHRSRPALSSTTAATAGDADRANDGAPGRRVSSAGSGNRQAFPLSWASINHSPMGLNSGITEQLHRGKVTRACGSGRGLLEAERVYGTLATPASAGSAIQRQQQHNWRVDGNSINNRLDYSPRWHSTSRKGNHDCSSSSSSSGRSPGIIGGGSSDENTPPPPPRVHARPLSGRDASLSLPAVRRNLAMVARQSKVGTKADPVTLYRQRQELEQKMAKNAAARNRKKADRGGRPSGDSIWSNGQRAGGRVGMGVGTGSAAGLGGGKTRTSGGAAATSRIGMSLR
ncbi:unnamed protein product [Pylaiella littoralis]